MGTSTTELQPNEMNVMNITFNSDLMGSDGKRIVMSKKKVKRHIDKPRIQHIENSVRTGMKVRTNSSNLKFKINTDKI